jgi:hypothetical protein
MGKKRWIIPLAVAAVLVAALAAPLLSLSAALADTGDITKSDSGPYSYTAPDMTIDMDVQPHKVPSGGAQVQYTIDVRNVGAPLPTPGGSGNLPPSVGPTGVAINVSIWATLPPGFTFTSTDAIIEVGATRSSIDPSPGDDPPTWGYWDIAPGGYVTIAFTADVPPGLPPGTYDANAFASGYGFGIDDEGPTGGDPDTPLGEDPELDEDVTVGCTVGGIVEPVDPLGLAAAPGENSDEASTAISIALGIGLAVLIAAFLVWSLRRRRVISAGESH